MNLDELQRVAEAATPGPWQAKECGSEGIDGGPCWCNVVCTTHPMPEDQGQTVVNSGSAFRNDAAHIAAFDPPTVLKLLAIARAAMKAVEPIDVPYGVINRKRAIDALRQSLEGVEL